MHPLYTTFQTLKNSKIQIAKNFLPVPKEHLELTPPPVSLEIKKMGCLVLAGGQGTRLGIEGPKGCVKLPLKEEKSLFQLFFEKVKAKDRSLLIAIMTSPLNHDATAEYLQNHAYFGVDSQSVSLFSQEMMKVSDEAGQVFYDQRKQIAEAPDGNGRALYHLYQSGIWEKWSQLGVEVVQIIPIDNPLSEPFDEELLGVHKHSGAQLVLKCIKREDPEEKLGVIGIEDGHLTIHEYSELTDRMKQAREGEHLQFFLGNSGLFSCTMDFVEKVQSVALPWHLAKKKGICAKQEHGEWRFKTISVWKFESFIFDLFPYAKSFKIILSNRKRCFAPLKNLRGPDSLETVAKALSER